MLGAAAFEWVMRAGVEARGPEEGAVLLGDVSPARVACRACGASVDDDAIERGIAEGSVPCPAGHAIAVRAVPPEMGREPWWSALVGESEREPVAPSAEPVQFTCASCGAALLADGTTRTPPCRYCGTRAYLPEDLWRTLRPTPRVEPFYLWVDRAWYEQWTRGRAAQFWWSFGTWVAVWAGVYVALLGMDYRVGAPSSTESGWSEAAHIWLCAGWMAASAAAAIVNVKCTPTRTR
jgi:DNA-directed RNA polymerase subunit RPC12/RpoP